MAAQSKTANKSAIDLQITTNGNNEITGAELNGILDNIVDSYEDFVGSYTTVQIAALVGMTLRQRVFNTTDNDYEWYDGTRWVKEAHPKYKVYKALLTQTGTNAPAATVRENTLGGTVVWTRDFAGVYTGTLAGAFTDLKTFPIVSNNYDESYSYKLGRATLNTVSLAVHDGAAGTDNGLLDTPVEIQVYY